VGDSASEAEGHDIAGDLATVSLLSVKALVAWFVTTGTFR
jgi:hypothetical protein